MIYPEFLRTNDTIGIAAPSSGVGKKIESYERSLQVLRSNGWQIKETPSVRNEGDRSADAVTRAEEFVSLFKDGGVNFVMCAAGGDFLFEILEDLDFEEMRNHPKWISGHSDPTGILYPYTVKYDVATFYAMNAGGYDVEPMPEYIQNNLRMLRGERVIQKSSKMHMKTPTFLAEKVEFDTPTKWISSVGDFEAEGRCIGGCMDVLKDLIGTKFDDTCNFVEKYKEDGQIWFFDVFSMSSENVYRTLRQMRYAGWFAHTKAIILGRVLFESSDTDMTYQEAAEWAVRDIPVITEADVGHTLPYMTMINGALMHLIMKDDKAQIQFSFK